MTPLCFIDTETTGVHPDRRVWEVAMIRRDFDTAEDGQTIRTDTTVQLFVDVDLSNADPFGLHVGRFYDRHPLFSDTTDDTVHTEMAAAAIVEEYTRGAHLVGVVPSFDAGCLDPMLRRHRLIPAWHYHLVDVEALAAGYLHGQGNGRCTCGAEQRGEAGHPTGADCGVFRFNPTLPWKSDDLSAALGVEPASPEERHTALGDARWAMRIYDAITGGAQ